MPWCPLALWNSIMIRGVNFLGTTIAGSVVYLSLITFLRMLLWSNRKLGLGFFFMSLTLLLHNQSHCCSFLSTSKLGFPHIIGWLLWGCICRMSFFSDVLTMSSTADGMSSLSLFWYRPSVLSLDMASATTFLLCWKCLNLMSNCCSSRAHLSSTGLDMQVVKNGASGLWSQYSVHLVPAK